MSDAVIEQAAIDRGDFLEPPVKVETPPVVTPEDKALEAELLPTDKGDEAKADEAKTDKGEEEETPRNEKGQFEPRIPKARFDEAVGKEREAREAAEARAADLERQLAEKAKVETNTAKVTELETKVTELETQYTQLVLDGEPEKAAAVMREIRMAERQIVRMEQADEAKSTTTQILEAERFELTVARLEAEHSELNPKSETYDADLVQMIVDRQRSLVAGGMAPSAAMTQAAEKILEREAKLRAPATEKVEEKGLSTAATDRKAAQVAKNVEAAKAQAPSTKETGLDSDKVGEKALPNVAQMTPEEYQALPESTRARLRGDLL